MKHNSPLSQYEARMVADYIEEQYQFHIGKTSLWRMTPEAASTDLMTKFGLSIDANEIRRAAKRM